MKKNNGIKFQVVPLVFDASWFIILHIDPGVNTNGFLSRILSKMSGCDK